MLEPSGFIWRSIPGFPYIQYPWRFLVYADFALSIMISMALLHVKKAKQIILALVIIAGTIFLNAKYFTPREYFSIKPQDYTGDLNLRFKISKISDEYMPEDFQIPESVQDISWHGLADNPDLKIIASAEYPTKKLYKVDVLRAGNIETNIAYFPGWQAKIDGADTSIWSNRGKVQLLVPYGQHDLEFIFRDTPIRLAANAISILAIFLVVYIILLR